MFFASRQDAGRTLGRHLREIGVEVDLVAGVPRGGVIVAGEVARILKRPLGVIGVRKIGHPWHRELAVGALAENNITLLDENVIGDDILLRAALETVMQEENARLLEYQEKFHQDKKTDFSGKSVLVVDDGLATGATAEAAVLSAKKQGAQKIFVAIPVASSSAIERLMTAANGVTALVVDPAFSAVGQYYKAFPETSDDEVLEVLRGQTENGGQSA
jgi:predicted phosphoribosyltransferase